MQKVSTPVPMARQCPALPLTLGSSGGASERGQAGMAGLCFFLTTSATGSLRSRQVTARAGLDFSIWTAGGLASGFNLNIQISPFSSGIDWIKASALALSTDVCNSFIKDTPRALSVGQAQDIHVNHAPSSLTAGPHSVFVQGCQAIVGRKVREGLGGRGVGFLVGKSHAGLIHTCPEMGVEECGSGGKA